MESFPHKNPEKVISINLVELKKQLLDQIDRLEDQFDEKSEKEKISFSHLKKEKQLLVKKFIHSLLEQKELFQFIFETKKGSLYFVAKNGQSWRFKKEDNFLKIQPILNKIIFLSPQEAEAYMNLKKKPLFEEYLVGSPELANQPKPYVFKKSTLAIGNIPLEIGIDGYEPVIFEENENELKIIGTQTSDGTIQKTFASGIHIGHPISKIY